MERAYTLIELLIVIALVGILAVALLAAINPTEQAKKARDSGRISDAVELLDAYERYSVTFSCLPWNGGSGVNCGTTALSGAENPNFNPAGNSYNLIFTNEIKAQFQNRSSITKNELFVSETNGPNGVVSVCFEPESQSWRSRGEGLRNQTNTSDASCSGSYGSDTCYICFQ